MSDNIKSGFLLIDSTSSVQYFDDDAKEILGITEDLLNKKIDALVTDHALLSSIHEAMDSKSILVKEVTLEDDMSKILSLKVEPFKFLEHDGFFILISDLSKLRKLEEMQKEFVANVSHELRTPLTSIRMASETLQMGAINDEKMRDKFLSNIQREADRLTRLVNELLVLARLDNKVKLQISKINTVEMLTDVFTVMKHHADLNDITLNKDFPEDLPLIEADRDRIQQVLINLTDNGIKCNRKNGAVTIFAKATNDNLEIKIIDTGIGIHKVDIDKIFDRFFRVDKSRSRVTGGTGLGLSIVKDLIVAHGGNITVESEVNVGTTFCIVLPLKQK
ncbi:MAG: ATP-binding protein [Candidatus Sericytochromatia bacterium]